MKVFTGILIILILLTGCESEVKVITGTVAGKVVATSPYHKYLPGQEDVKVNLYSDTAVAGTAMSDGRGYFHIKDVPYGKYYLKAFKEKFVPSWSENTIYHVGGSSPSMQDVYIDEVPGFQITVDSLGFTNLDGTYILFWIRSDTIVPTGWFRVFADSLSNVTKDKYTSAGKGSFQIYYPNYPTVVPTYGKISIYDFDSGINKLKSDTIFLRLYPTAGNQGYSIMEFYPEALGKPSNLVKFLWSELIQK
jgi:hypothetical protein